MSVSLQNKNSEIALAEPAESTDVAIEIRGLNAYYGKFLAVSDVNIDLERNKVTGLIGPSGSGKSTLLRTINRIHETAPKARVTGSIRLDGVDIYANAGATRYGGQWAWSSRGPTHWFPKVSSTTSPWGSRSQACEIERSCATE